jgi:hypothetical protein
MRGQGYVAWALDDAALSVLREADGGPRPFLWFTSPGGTARAADAEIVRVDALGTGAALDARRPQDLRTRVAAFLAGRDGGIVVVDCTDLLVNRNGAERAMRALQDLHEEIASHAAILVVLVDARSTGARMLAWLEREFDILPSVALDRALASAFPA